MAQPYIGEIILLPYTFAPVGWAFCDGQLMPIAENETLFNLIGTTYGGDGEDTFALPDLRGRAPIHVNPGSPNPPPGLSTYQFAESGGVETVTLTVNQTPVHTHVIDSSDLTAVARARNAAGNQLSPVGNLPASAPYAFNDDPVVANLTAIKAAHLIELRQRVDGFRLGVGLGPYPYVTDPVLTVGTTLIKAQHLLEVRTALTQAYAQAMLPLPVFDPNLASDKPVKALHINELRSALSTATGGGVPRYSGGPANAAMAAGALTIGGGATGLAGGSQPHNNLQPYLVMHYCISLFGIFPSQ